jgi:uracil-DNA glycosylase
VSELPVLVGEAPSRGGDRFHHFPLSGPPARVLCVLAGIPPQEDGSTYGRWTWALYDRFECRNLFARYRDATPWSAPAARGRAEALAEELAPRVVVCLGRRVQAALHGALGLAVPAVPFHEWRTGQPDEPTAWTTIPHPSGLNRALNDAAERERCGETLRKALDLSAA